MRKFVVFVLAILLLASNSGGVFAATAASTKKPSLVAVYVSPEGIRFESYSRLWDQQKLKDLYALFRQLPKGEEVKYLGKVMLKERGSVAGLWHGEFQTVGGKTTMKKGRYIELFHAEQKDKPLEEFGWVLSHEYGHHFSYYWLLKKEGKYPQSPNTGWAKIRGIKGYPVYQSKQHFWNPSEIMADDYAVMFAPAAVKKWLTAEPDEYFNRPYGLTGYIENQFIPAAESVSGLRAYWAKLSGLKLDAPVLKAPGVQAVKASIITDEYGFEETVYEVDTNPVSLKAEYQYTVMMTDRMKPFGTYTYDLTPFRDGAQPLVYQGADPEGKQNVRVYVYDPKTQRISYSGDAWFDFSDPLNPKPIASQTKW